MIYQDQAPPSAPEAEAGVLGAILLDSTVLDDVGQIVRPIDFLNPGNRKLYSTMLAMRNGGGGSIDALLLKERLREAGELEEIGGEARLAEIATSVPYAKNAADYAGIVRETAGRREIINLASGLVRDAYAGHTSAASLAQQGRSVLESIEPDDADNPFQVIGCNELADGDYNVQYLVENALVEGVPNLIGGQLKTLKTRVTVALAISLATGEPFLGKFAVPEARRIIYFLGEGGLSVAQRYTREVAESLGYSLRDVTGLMFCDTVPQLTDAGELAAMAKVLRNNEATVAILDPLYLAMDSKDSGNIMAMGPIFRAFNRMCAEQGVTPVIVHHLRKNRPNAGACDPPELADLSWSGSAEYAASWILIGRQEPYDAEHPGQHSLWLNCGGRAGHSSLHVLKVDEGTRDDWDGRGWQVDVIRPSEARGESAKRLAAERETVQAAKQEERLEADKREVCRAMAKFPLGESKTVIRGFAGVSGTRVSVALASLLNDGSAVMCDVFKSGKKTPLEGYKLVDSSSPYGGNGTSGTNSPGQPGPTGGHQERDKSPLRGCPIPVVHPRD